ncbi:hypothetical protein HK102_001989 [Quaeritorhiza haematococci]|nr:hypothetical protein HK102_001989 [Quaeritorhiza haematococci]
MGNLLSDANGNWSSLPPYPIFKLGIFLINLCERFLDLVMPPPAKFIKMSMGFLLERCLYVAAKLRIADVLDREPNKKATIGVLAEKCGARENELERVLNCLIMHGIFRKTGQHEFANNWNSVVLKSDHPDSMMDFILHFGEAGHDAGRHMLEMITDKTSDKCAYERSSNGEPFWTWLGRPENKESRDSFDRAMISMNNLLNTIVEDFDFSPYDTVCDVGGGFGGFLRQLMNRYPGIRGTLFDLPNVIQQAEQTWNKECSELVSRNTFVKGSFFDSIPPSQSAYILRQILHDWTDEQSISILKTVRASASPSSTLLVIDICMDKLFHPAQIFADLHMLNMFGAKERSVEEMRGLFEKSGWRMEKVWTGRTTHAVYVGRPVVGWQQDSEGKKDS